MEYIFEDPGRGGTVTVRIEPERGSRDRYEATIDGRTVPCTVRRRANAMWLEFEDGRSVAVATARTESGIAVWAEGERCTVTPEDRTPKRSGGADAAVAHDQLVAPMPGTVLKVLVGEGDAFDADATLIVMESMKMEMSLSVARAGVVAEVACAEGDLVDMNDLLVRLEPVE